MHQTLSIADLLSFRNFPIAHARRLDVHRRQSLGRRPGRWLSVRWNESVGSGDPDATVPHDWCESLQRFRARREPVEVEVDVGSVAVY